MTAIEPDLSFTQNSEWIAEREERKEVVAELVGLPNVELIQEIGKVVLLYRYNKRANPKLSNVQR